MNVMRDPEYLRKLTSLRDKLVNIREELDEMIEDSQMCKLTAECADIAIKMADEELKPLEDDDYLKCVHNCWTGLAGRETCEAGYLFCSGEDCAAFVKGSPVSRRMYG